MSTVKNLNNTIPGYKIFEYMLVLNPHEELRQKITHVKRSFQDVYKVSTAYTSPQVLLLTFTQYEMVEEKICSRLKVIAMGYKPFKVELKDFGSFPSHTVYINVTSKLPIQALVKTIRSEAQALLKMDTENKPHFILEPHLTIARKLQPWQFEQSWLEYSQKPFTGRFIADGMLLLRRPLDEASYEVAAHLAFQNLPVATKQGNLFG